MVVTIEQSRRFNDGDIHALLLEIVRIFGLDVNLCEVTGMVASLRILGEPPFCTQDVTTLLLSRLGGYRLATK